MNEGALRQLERLLARLAEQADERVPYGRVNEPARNPLEERLERTARSMLKAGVHARTVAVHVDEQIHAELDDPTRREACRATVAAAVKPIAYYMQRRTE